MSVASLVSLFLIGVAVRAQDCPRGFELHENMCYHFSGGEETWIRAYLSCQLFDSQLVEIESAEEDEYLRNKTISIGNKHYFWIGLTDKLIEGEYVWETSKDLITPGDYINWGLGEPDNADENCVFLAPSRNYTWADSDCTRTEHYICETDPNIGAVVG